MTTTQTRTPSSVGLDDNVFPQMARIAATRDVAQDVLLLELARADGGQWPRWSPGAHIDLVLEPGLVRQYSLCGDQADRRHLRVAVLREAQGRGGSAFVHERLRAGDTIEVGGLRNHFELEPAERYLFVAGGIGITPLLPMIEQVDRSGCPWSLAYGGRATTSMAFSDELVARYGDAVRLYPLTVAAAIPLGELVGDASPGTTLYACGPEGLLAAVEQHVGGRSGLTLHVERFRAAPDKLVRLDRPLVVELARSGRTIQVPAERSILSALREHRIQVDSSCQEGSCGSCEVAVLAGTPDHRDSVLSLEEQQAGDCMMVCVSRARTDTLTLDL